MNRIPLAAAIASLGLAACSGPVSTASSSGGHGRYSSAGLYPAGKMWRQLAGAPTTSAPAQAKLADDEQIIVVLDSQTGELRQCGNLSGFCVGMNPWSKPVGASAPLAVAKHSDQLDAEAEAEAKAREAAASKAP